MTGKTPRPSATTAGLMALVLWVALGIGLLKNASPTLAWLTMIATAASAGWAILQAIFRRDGARAFWVGALLFGLVYAALTITPLPLVTTSAGPPGTRLLARLRPIFQDEEVRFHQDLPRDRFDEAFSEWSTGHPSSEAYEITLDPEDPSAVVRIIWAERDLISFPRIGHCLLGLVWAFLGGVLTSRLVLYRSHRTNRPGVST